eukprot:767519-Hanusia_phi.AAC.5
MSAVPGSETRLGELWLVGIVPALRAAKVVDARFVRAWVAAPAPIHRVVRVLESVARVAQAALRQNASLLCRRHSVGALVAALQDLQLVARVPPHRALRAGRKPLTQALGPRRAGLTF